MSICQEITCSIFGLIVLQLKTDSYAAKIHFPTG